MYTSEFDGVKFVEGRPDGAKLLGEVSTTIGVGLVAGQSKNLDDVKRDLAAQVKAKGGNALVDFKYGQKSSFWLSFFSRDDVTWHGSGQAAVL